MKKYFLAICLILSLIFSGCSLLPEIQNRDNQSQDTINHKAEATEAKQEESSITPTEALIKEANLKAPILKSVTPLDIDEFEIAWSSVDGADGYLLSCKEDNEEFQELADIKAPTTEFNHKNLSDSVTYTYKVVAYKESNSSKITSDESNAIDQLCNNNIINFYQPYRSQTYVEYRGSDTFIMSGKHYTNGFTLSADSSKKDLYVDYNLEGKYKSIQFSYAFVDGIKSSDPWGYEDEIHATLKVLGDDKIIETYEVSNSQVVQTVKLDIENVKKFEIYIEHTNSTYRWTGEFGFADVELFK